MSKMCSAAANSIAINPINTTGNVNSGSTARTSNDISRSPPFSYGHACQRDRGAAEWWCRSKISCYHRTNQALFIKLDRNATLQITWPLKSAGEKTRFV